jgi:hypothetical protein
MARLAFPVALALAFAGSARAKNLPIPSSGIGAKATADYQGDALGITATPDGARLRCGFQKLEGHATAEGVWLESTVPGGGEFRLVLKCQFAGKTSQGVAGENQPLLR